jgi:hypothetical protein
VTDKRAEPIAELIKPLRVKPGSKVNLAKDFDPGYKAGCVKAQAPGGAAADPFAAGQAKEKAREKAEEKAKAR